MCGVLAIRSCAGPVDEEQLRRSTRALAHRGPDGSDVWISPDRSIGLGHTRLAIMDPMGGSQPMPNEDGRRQIVVNGEFYGFETIRRSLVSGGHRFRTRSDSEIALHLYEDMGVRCVERLRGQFAFVLWDEDTRTLFAARDRFGMKPLFYHRSNEALILASEAKAIFAAGVEPQWDLWSVYHTLHACPDERRSLFEGVVALPPGHILISTPNGLRIERYWDLQSPDESRETVFATEVERIRQLVTESVRLRTRSDVPLGCLLSGGLDSSSVLGIAARTDRSRRMRAFTIGFDDPDYDEGHLAERTARELGVDFDRIGATERAIADHFVGAVRHAETVQYNAHGTARFLLSQHVHRAGYRTVLAGEGADEAFLGYEFLQRTRALTKRPSPGPGLVWKLMRHTVSRPTGLGRASPWLARILAAMDGSPTLVERLSGGLEHLRGVLSPEFLEPFKGFDVYRNYYQTANDRAGISRWPPVRQILYLWLHSPFVNYHLGADRLDMAHGVEVRLPFLDHVLFEHVQATPVNVLMHGTQEKAVLREAAGPYVPTSVCERPKKPFWAPASAAQPGTPLHTLAQDTLRSRALSDVPFLDRGAVVRLLDSVSTSATREDPDADAVLSVLMSVVILAEAYGP